MLRKEEALESAKINRTKFTKYYNNYLMALALTINERYMKE